MRKSRAVASERRQQGSTICQQWNLYCLLSRSNPQSWLGWNFFCANLFILSTQQSTGCQGEGEVAQLWVKMPAANHLLPLHLLGRKVLSSTWCWDDAVVCFAWTTELCHQIQYKTCPANFDYISQKFVSYGLQLRTLCDVWMEWITWKIIKRNITIIWYEKKIICSYSMNEWMMLDFLRWYFLSSYPLVKLVLLRMGSTALWAHVIPEYTCKGDQVNLNCVRSKTRKHTRDWKRCGDRRFVAVKKGVATGGTHIDRSDQVLHVSVTRIATPGDVAGPAVASNDKAVRQSVNGWGVVIARDESPTRHLLVVKGLFWDLHSFIASHSPTANPSRLPCYGRGSTQSGGSSAAASFSGERSGLGVRPRETGTVAFEMGSCDPVSGLRWSLKGVILKQCRWFPWAFSWFPHPFLRLWFQRVSRISFESNAVGSTATVLALLEVL